MSAPLPEIAGSEPVNQPAWLLALRRGENLVVVLALGVMMLLPVAEIVLRKTIGTGITASATMVQHLVLAVGMLGGAIAARDNRLLALSAAAQWFKGGVLTFSRIVGYGFAAAVSAVLALASWEFVMSQRPLGKIFAYGVPVWVVQLLLVIGFALIAVRLVWHAADRWVWKFATLALTAGLLAFVHWTSIDPEQLRWPAMIVLLVSVALGAPIFTALGGAALILFWTAGEGLAGVPLKHYGLTVNPSLPSIPLFTLAGYFLAESGAAKRLVRLFQALFGSLRGGPAIVATLVCAFFTSFTGASGATILALGGVLMPVLLAAKFSERSSLGLLTGAGSLGMLFPPCLPPILYAIIASTPGSGVSISIEEIFQGGLLPGALLVLLTVAWGLYEGRKAGDAGRQAFDRREALAAIWAAKWELLVPVVALTALFGGFATPVEAAALTAFYTFLVAVLVHRDLNLFRDVPRVMTECGLLVGGVMLILGVALGFTHYMIDAQIPDQAVAWATGAIHSKWIFLLGLNVVLLIVGGLVEIYAAIVVVVPLLVPLGLAFGIDPIHLGIIFLANMELGFLAPPVGLNLLLSSYRFNKPMTEVTRASMPMLAVMFVGVLLITYIPALTTWLPGIFR
ncbi:MAG TPA: TRAP transporter large permease subunit [Opitutaceae bacterium]|nr:TRAP transporter large permease subunit [Opitutaceae bacterium]